MVIQSRSASFIASFSVRVPESTTRTLAPRSFMRKTLSDWRCDVFRAHEDLAVACRSSAATVAVATPCWPAPVSAMIRRLPMRSAPAVPGRSCC